MARQEPRTVGNNPRKSEDELRADGTHRTYVWNKGISTMWTDAKTIAGMKRVRKQLEKQDTRSERLLHKKAFTSQKKKTNGNKDQFLPSIKWEYRKPKKRDGIFPPTRTMSSFTKKQKTATGMLK